MDRIEPYSIYTFFTMDVRSHLKNVIFLKSGRCEKFFCAYPYYPYIQFVNNEKKIDGILFSCLITLDEVYVKL